MKLPVEYNRKTHHIAVNYSVAGTAKMVFRYAGAAIFGEYTQSRQSQRYAASLFLEVLVIFGILWGAFHVHQAVCAFVDSGMRVIANSYEHDSLHRYFSALITAESGHRPPANIAISLVITTCFLGLHWFINHAIRKKSSWQTWAVYLIVLLCFDGSIFWHSGQQERTEFEAENASKYETIDPTQDATYLAISAQIDAARKNQARYETRLAELATERAQVQQLLAQWESKKTPWYEKKLGAGTIDAKIATYKAQIEEIKSEAKRISDLAAGTESKMTDLYQDQKDLIAKIKSKNEAVKIEFEDELDFAQMVGQTTGGFLGLLLSFFIYLKKSLRKKETPMRVKTPKMPDLRNLKMPKLKTQNSKLKTQKPKAVTQNPAPANQKSNGSSYVSAKSVLQVLKNETRVKAIEDYLKASDKIDWMLQNHKMLQNQNAFSVHYKEEVEPITGVSFGTFYGNYRDHIRPKWRELNKL